MRDLAKRGPIQVLFIARARSIPNATPIADEQYAWCFSIGLRESHVICLILMIIDSFV